MRKAIMYGAGNIGRGFIGALFAQSGYAVTFVDVAEEVVARLHNEGHYPIRIVGNGVCEDLDIPGVDAVNGHDVKAVTAAIAGADILATAVGAKALPHIVPNIAAGLRMRWKTTDTPLNILICENLMDANRIMESLIRQQLEPDEYPLLDKRVGLVETSIGRMVPVQTPEMRDGDPLRICVERYDFLPVDKDAFKGNIPHIERMIPFSPFDFYLKRKLYLHNMAHAVCAYLGMYTGIEYIWEAIEEPSVRLIVKEAMCESMVALAEEYDTPMQGILAHADDLLIRFTNRALRDTCARVGCDPARKLGAGDRLIGAAKLCEKHGIPPLYIAIGAAGALYQYLNEQEQLQNDENAATALHEISGLSPEEELSRMVLELYSMYRKGTNTRQLYKAAQNKKKKLVAGVV